MRVVPVLFLVGIIEIFSVSASIAQNPEPDSLTWYWHQAYFSEVSGDPRSVISNYKKVMEFCEAEPLDVREWFKGISLFGIARANAVLADKEATKASISKALARHFWNFPVVRSLKIFDTLCGKEWMDSLCDYWSSVRDREIALWHSQPTYIMKPHHILPGVKYPLVVALEGGNDCYERLVMRLRELPDSLSIILAIPAGVHRLSEVSNSWDDDTIAGEAKIESLIKEMATDSTVDMTNISLLGFSQGSQISYGYGFSHSEQIRNIIAFSGFAPPYVSFQELKDAASHHLQIVAISGPTDSPDFLNSTRQLQHAATDQGINFDMKIEKDLPHGFPINMTSYCAKIWRQLSNYSPDTKGKGSQSEKPDVGTPQTLHSRQNSK